MARASSRKRNPPPFEDRSTYGELLEELSDRKGWTKAKIAKLLGVDPSTVTRKIQFNYANDDPEALDRLVDAVMDDDPTLAIGIRQAYHYRVAPRLAARCEKLTDELSEYRNPLSAKSALYDWVRNLPEATAVEFKATVDETWGLPANEVIGRWRAATRALKRATGEIPES